jgi:uncharacterized protein
MSDIHGSFYYLKKAIEAYEREKCDYIIILGDALYHGPRNSLPKEYDPKAVAEVLNSHKNNIIAVRGNCDSEVDQMLISYPMMSDYSVILYNNRRLFLTHGHIYNKNNLLNIDKNDVLIYGHTHIPLAEKEDGKIILNPGSISLPKNNNPNSYAILENDIFTVKNLDGDSFISIEL